MLPLRRDPGLLLQGAAVVRESGGDELRPSSRLPSLGAAVPHTYAPSFGTSQRRHTRQSAALTHQGLHPCTLPKAQARKAGACVLPITMQTRVTASAMPPRCLPSLALFLTMVPWFVSLSTQRPRLLWRLRDAVRRTRTSRPSPSDKSLVRFVAESAVREPWSLR